MCWVVIKRTFLENDSFAFHAAQFYKCNLIVSFSNWKYEFPIKNQNKIASNMNDSDSIRHEILAPIITHTLLLSMTIDNTIKKHRWIILHWMNDKECIKGNDISLKMFDAKVTWLSMVAHKNKFNLAMALKEFHAFYQCRSCGTIYFRSNSGSNEGSPCTMCHLNNFPRSEVCWLWICCMCVAIH